ncbi:hypothetical protein JQN59_22470 [Citrobacter sp. B72]|nr:MULTISPECIES: hypothetical protein [Citrobacter]QRQ76565.1 hypothetical protein JQN59_22470 [Citrobacter sp. B72]
MRLFQAANDSSPSCRCGFFHRFAQFRIQTLNFMGESLLTMVGEGQEHFAYESICQLGHSLVNISQLIPALVQLEAKADQQLFAVA